MHLIPIPKLWWWWQSWDYGVSVCSFSTVSPHGLLPPLSFYSLLLGDASLSPNVTQAKTPLSSFARARYRGNTAIPPLLFFTHLLSSLIPPTSSPPSLQPGLDTEFVFWSMGMLLICESEHYTWNSSLEFHIWQVQPRVFLQPCSFRHLYFAVEKMLVFAF